MRMHLYVQRPGVAPQEVVNLTDAAGMTPLMWAAYYNRHAHVKKLLAHGADTEEKDMDGKTAMHWVRRRDPLHPSPQPGGA